MGCDITATSTLITLLSERPALDPIIFNLHSVLGGWAAFHYCGCRRRRDAMGADGVSSSGLAVTMKSLHWPKAFRQGPNSFSSCLS